jgi:hypothetical protein
MRDGVEDYDCLRMLQDLLRAKGHKAPAYLRKRAQRALTMTPDLYKTMASYPTEAGAMVQRRREINELIVQFGKL